MSRYRWVILGAGTLAQTSISAVLIGLAAIAPALRDHYSLGLGRLGIVLGAVGAGVMPTLLPWGILADRVATFLAPGERERKEAPAPAVEEPEPEAEPEAAAA